MPQNDGSSVLDAYYANQHPKIEVSISLTYFLIPAATSQFPAFELEQFLRQRVREIYARKPW